MVTKFPTVVSKSSDDPQMIQVMTIPRLWLLRQNDISIKWIASGNLHSGIHHFS